MTDRPTAPRHDEIPENTTDPTIAALYAQIRTVSGLPGINLFYRRLAYAGAHVLASFWNQVEPLYSTRRLHDAGATLEGKVTPPGVCALDGPLFKAAGLARDDRASVRATLRYFNQANAMHLVLFSVIAHAVHDAGRDLPAAPVDVASPPVNRDAELLPLISWDDTPPASRVLIDAIRDRLAPGMADTIRPTLLRHFAPYPVLLASVHGFVAAHNAALLDTIEAARQDALALANTLARDVTFTFTDDVRQPVETTTAEFRQIIPTMLVLGTAMVRGF
jgi:hypothetical protein